jgi:hypothetical protein
LRRPLPRRPGAKGSGQLVHGQQAPRGIFPATGRELLVGPIDFRTCRVQGFGRARIGVRQGEQRNDAQLSGRHRMRAPTLLL